MFFLITTKANLNQKPITERYSSSRAGELLARAVECLLGKQDNLSLHLPHPRYKPGVAVCACNPGAGEVEAGFLGPATVTALMSARLSEVLCPKIKEED